MTQRLDDAVRAAVECLGRAGVVSARSDAEHLAAHVLGLAPGQLRAAVVTGRDLAAPQAERLAALVAQRADRVPLQHLTGRAAFRTLELDVGPGVFVPRPETEVVAGLAIDEARRLTDPLVVDLCTGSAAIALSVAVEVPLARVVALELDPHAHAWARRNVDRAAAVPAARVDLRLGDVAGADGEVLADLVGAADVVVANPPYIPDGARPVDPEVADHDPHAALYGGGEDGLAVPAAVVRTAAALLRAGGLLVMEHGDLQAAAVRSLVATSCRPGCWQDVRTEPDLTGRDRAVVARRADHAVVAGRADRAVVACRAGGGGGTRAKVRDFPS